MFNRHTRIQFSVHIFEGPSHLNNMSVQPLHHTLMIGDGELDHETSFEICATMTLQNAGFTTVAAEISHFSYYCCSIAQAADSRSWPMCMPKRPAIEPKSVDFCGLATNLYSGIHVAS
jgi:hypothetical protein